ncbi:MAG: hypothetical protein K2M47_02550 [Clostridiales bacterium]|nr:hypothetical protein [Clostridiales bacterium]
MFENALWQSRPHTNQPLWYLMGPMIVFLVAIPFVIHFFGVGVVFGIDVVIALGLLFAVCIVGRKFKWHNNKLLFAVMSNGVYFTVTNNNQNNSYFQEDFSNVKGYSCVQEGGHNTVTIFFKQPANAGVFGNITFMKMIKIENFDKLQEVLNSFSIPVIENNK